MTDIFSFDLLTDLLARVFGRHEQEVADERAPVEIAIAVRGHRGEPLVITPFRRSEHVLDALFDDVRLEDGLRRVELTRETITLAFAARCGAKIHDIAEERLADLLAAPRWVVGERQE